MRFLARRSTAILTFAVGIVAVWYFQQPVVPSSRFLVQAAPAPVRLTPEQIAALPNFCGNFVVSIEVNRSLKMNESVDVGSVEDPGKLTVELLEMFQERVRNRAYAEGITERPDFAKLSEEERTEKVQVTIRAPRSVAYGDVMRVIDAARGGGASPILLQVDDLPQ